MDFPLRRVLLVFACALWASHSLPSFGHGGAYRGPGGSAPPGSGGSSSGPADSVSGGGGGSSGAGGPSRAGGGGSPSSGGAGPRTSGPSVPTGPPAADTSTWQNWWAFNKERWLDVKAAVHGTDVLLGSDSYFLGYGLEGRVRDRLAPSEETIREKVVPALLRVLEDERDNDLVTGALVALAKIGDREGAPPGQSVAPRILPFLADPNQEIAETAALSLGILASTSSVPTLLDLLHGTERGLELVGHEVDVPLRTRAFAAFGLGLIGHRCEDEDLRRDIVAALVRALEGQREPTPEVEVACVTALGLVPLGAPIVDPTVPRRAGAIDGLAAQIDWLVAFTSDRGRRDLVRAHAPVALARLAVRSEDAAQHERVVRTLLALLQHDAGAPRQVRQSAALALGFLGDSDEQELDRAVRSALSRAASDGRDRDLMHFAVLSLASVAARPGAGEDPLSALAETRRALMTRLARGSSTERPWAALGLGLLGRGLSDHKLEPARDVDAALRAALEEARAPRDVGAYSIALGLRRCDDASRVLLEQLAGTGDDETRGHVSLALGMIGDGVALGPIQEVLRRSKYRPELLRQAAISLGLLGDKDLVPELIGLLHGATSLSAQASIAQGLGAIGDVRSIDPLLAMLADTEVNARARSFAAVALGIVADKEPRPWNAKLAIGVNYLASTTTMIDGKGAGVLEIL